MPLKRNWQVYKHRFTPWLALNWSSRQIKRSDGRLSKVQERVALRQLTSLLTRLDQSLPQFSVREVRRLLGSRERLERLHERGREELWAEFGFCLEVCESRLVGGGRGVAISQGKVPTGHLVALYPGTVYMPHEPLLLQSLRNPFVFRCLDGVMIDGNDRGLSRWIYKSCAFRDVIGGGGMMSCDVTWLTGLPSNPLSLGQMVNNHTRDVPSNVEYAEITVPHHLLPHSLWRYLPNVYYCSSTQIGEEQEDRSCGGGMRCVVVMSTTDIDPGTELYSSYLTLVHTATPPAT